MPAHGIQNGKVISEVSMIPIAEQSSGVQIVYGNKQCFAQWEDCGPFNTVDYQYVFGNKPPMNSKNQGAGIDLSPAIRDYLSLTSGDKVHWRFVEDHQIPHGPWKTYGKYVSTQPVSNETRVEAYNRKMKEFNEKIEAERQERIRRLDAMISKSESQ